MHSRLIIRTGVLLLLCFILAGCLGRRRRVVVVERPVPVAPGSDVVDAGGPTIAPPAPQPEIRSVSPSRFHVWIPGHWTWKRGKYVWARGHWKKPTRRGAVWVGGHWGKVRGGYCWIPGHWR